MITNRAAARARLRPFIWILASIAAVVSAPLSWADDSGSVGADASEVSARTSPNPLLAIDQNRASVVERIVVEWGDSLAKTNAGIDSAQLGNLLAGLRADHLLAASLAGNLEGLRNVVSAALVSESAVNASLVQPKSLGDASQDLVYVPVTPCRLVETRGTFAAVYQTAGAFTPGQVRTYKVEGGNGACLTQLPAGLSAAAVQMQVFAMPTTTGSGDVEILPQGGVFGSTATMVYIASIAFNTVSTNAKVNPANKQISVQVRGGGANLAIDVVGYFRAPAGGYVSSITAGTGLSGGTITGTGTIGIADGGVATTQLATKAVTQAKLSPATAPTAGQVLASDGTNLKWQTVSGGGGGVTAVTASAPLASSGGTAPDVSLTGTIPVGNGGTGRNALGTNGVVIGQGTGAVATAVGAMGQVLMGTAGAPTFTASPSFGGDVMAAGHGGIGAASKSTWMFYVTGGTTTQGILAEAQKTAISGIGNAGTGVYGQSNLASDTEAGVYGVNSAEGGIGVTGKANFGGGVGVYGSTFSPGGFGVYARNTGGGRALYVDGSAAQTLQYGGLVKAMIAVSNLGEILRCYNGQTGNSTVPCGFTLSHPVSGNYTIGFGFEVDDRFIALSPGRSPVPAVVYVAAFPTTTSITVGTTAWLAGELTPANQEFYLQIF